MTEENKNEALEVRNLAADADAQTAEDMIPEIQQKISQTKKEMPKKSKAGKILILLLAAFVIFSIVRIVQLQMERQKRKNSF